MNAIAEFVGTATRESIERLQNELAKLPQAELSTRHYFANGMYCRELLVPKGVVLVGKVHKEEHFCMLMAGDMTIVSDGRRDRIRAPMILISPPGVKRAGIAHEDSVFVNVHRTDLTDLDEIERELIEEDEAALFDAHNKLKQVMGELE